MPPRRRRSRPPHPAPSAPRIAPSRVGLALAGTALAGGLWLIALAAPRLEPAAAVALAKPAVDLLVAGKDVAKREIDEAAAVLAAGVDGFAEPEALAMLARLRLAQARLAPDDAAARTHAAQAAEAARQAVLGSPAHALAWTLYATALAELDPADPRLPRAAGMAAMAAGVDPRLLPARVELALRAWPALDAAARAAAGQGLRALAARNPQMLAEIARRTWGLDAVRDALEDDPALAASFDRAYIALP